MTREHFTEAEAALKKLAPELAEESMLRVGTTIQTERRAATEKHVARAKALVNDGRFHEGMDELTLAGGTGGDSEEVAFLSVNLGRRGDCALAIRAANDYAARYADSPRAERVSQIRKQCLALIRNGAKPQDKVKAAQASGKPSIPDESR